MSTGTITRTGAVFVLPGKGLKNSTSICGVTNSISLAGLVGLVTEPEGGLVEPTGEESGHTNS